MSHPPWTPAGRLGGRLHLGLASYASRALHLDHPYILGGCVQTAGLWDVDFLDWNNIRTATACQRAGDHTCAAASNRDNRGCTSGCRRGSRTFNCRPAGRPLSGDHRGYARRLIATLTGPCLPSTRSTLTQWALCRLRREQRSRDGPSTAPRPHTDSPRPGQLPRWALREEHAAPIHASRTTYHNYAIHRP